MRRLGLALLVVLGSWGTADAVERFAAHNGSGTTCSQGSPCTVATAKAGLAPGDIVTLIGSTDIDNPLVYTGDAGMLTITGLNGTPSAPIVFRCSVPGGCLLDGQFARSPLTVSSSSWLRFEDLNLRHASGSIPFVTGSSDIDLYRIVAWDRSDDGSTSSLSNLGTGGHQRIRCFDCAFFGVGRKTFNASQGGGSDAECHRCWIRYEGYSTGGGASTLRYNVRGTKLIDSLITYDAISVDPGPGQLGMGVLTDNGGQVGSCSGARIHGTLIYLRAGQRITLSNNYAGVRLGPSSTATDPAHNINCVHVRDSAVVVDPSHAWGGRGWFLPNNNGGEPSVDQVAANLLSVAKQANSIGTQWQQSNVVHRTSIPAVTDAAHPWNPSGTAAKLCHRFGTNQPKWPWPMNDRIKAATGYAGAYSGPCFGTCLRQTRTAYDVTAEIEALLGTIPAECRTDGGGGGTPPPTVTGAIVEYLIDAADETAGTTIEDHSTEGTDLDLDLVVE